MSLVLITGVMHDKLQVLDEGSLLCQDILHQAYRNVYSNKMPL